MKSITVSMMVVAMLVIQLAGCASSKKAPEVSSQERHDWCLERRLRGPHAFHDCLNGMPSTNNANF